MIQTAKRTKQASRVLLATLTLALIALPASAGICVCGCGSSPLILDLDRTGFIMTVDIHPGVPFDLDADGFAETGGWTIGHLAYGFLFLDQNGNGRVDNGRELFGNSTILPDGTTADNGFEALSVFDRLEHGGNGDFGITAEDSIWSSLRLWIDWSHDGISDPVEIFTLDDKAVVHIGLTYKLSPFVDGAGNAHKLTGNFFIEKTILGIPVMSEHIIEDVFFVLDKSSIPPPMIFSDSFESGDTLAWSDTCVGDCP